MADTETSEAKSKLSLVLMKLLYQIGMNKKMRRRRRYSFIQYEELDTFIDGLKTSIFGSQIEGSTTQGLRSDIDQVVYVPNTLAVRDIQDAVPGISNFLMVADDNTYSGYYKLQLLHPSSLEPLHVGNVIELKDENYISAIDRNQRVVLKPSSFTYEEVDEVHGPAITHSSGGTLNQDYIKAIRVNTWLQEAMSWILRRRHNNWIRSAEFEYFLTKEAFLVPVGNPCSLERQLEWRISFTTVERELMWRLNSTQMASYVLMKMINKCFITPTVGESLSSYHCKTALFHLIDNTDREFWKPNNLLGCLNLMLKTLSSWVESGFCPNYFITDENMFLGKVHGTLRRRLHSLLVHLIDQDFKYLTQIGCDGLGQVFSAACSKQQTQPILEAVQSRNGRDSHKIEFMDVTLLEICYHYKHLLQSGNTAMLHTLIHGYQSCSTVLQDALSVLIALLCSHFGSQLASSCIATNRMVCRDMEIAHMLLRIGTGSDVTTGRLKLAGFYLKLGYASLAEEVLTAVEHDFRHYVSDISPVDLHHLQDETCQKILSEEMTTDEIFRSSIALSAIYLPSEIHCTLPPLCYEMSWSVGANSDFRDPKKHYWYDWLEVDTRPYLYFLQHQTYSALGMNRHRLVAFQNLARVIEQKTITHPDTYLNLLAYCLRQEGLITTAFECLQLSLQINPEQNSAVWQICDMLNQTCNNQIVF